MRSLSEPSSVEKHIRKSRFLAHAARVDAQADTLAFYESVADAAATHNCWAWKLEQQHRFNDDGEPGGTAGRPILAAINARQVDHVMVVVTRWFGGIKLGVGGLIRAYGGVAAQCLESADMIELVEQHEYQLDSDFQWTGPVYAALKSCGASVVEESYDHCGLSIRITVESGAAQRLKAMLRDATRGEVGLILLS